MNFKFPKMNRAMSKTMLKLKKHSPEILITAGIIGIVTSAVMACRVSASKLPNILEETKQEIAEVKGASESEEVINTSKTEENSNNEVEVDSKELTVVYAKSAVKIVKLYAPSVILGALSISSIVTSHHVMSKRNAAIAAAYAAVDKGFKEYRHRLSERLGEDLDKELLYGIQNKEVEHIEKDKNGKEKVKKEVVQTVDPNSYSPYARFFDAGQPGWDENPEFTLMYLRQQQNYANEKLKSKGYLFLNEVYEMLGIPVTEMGNSVGWVYDEKNPVGDNFVDFGIYNGHDKAKVMFVNGEERTILLDFNVDGNVWDYI